MTQNSPHPPPDAVASIRAAYDSMSRSQQRVAEFLLTHVVEAVYLPAARIAELVSVSHSTVVRTAQALGFEGFPDLQTALQKQFLGRISTADRFQLEARQLSRQLPDQQFSENDLASVLQSVMLTDAKSIENVVNQIPVVDFKRAVDLLDSARRVYVVGMRGSAPLALSFGVALRNIRPECYILQPGFGDFADQFDPLIDEDVLMTMCYGRYMRDTLRCMDHARKIGTPVITLTDSTLSPPAKRADIAFVLPFRLWGFGASSAPYSLLNAFIVALELRHSATLPDRLGRIEGLFEQFEIFEPDDE